MPSHQHPKRYMELAEKWMNNSITPEEEIEFAEWYNKDQDATVDIPQFHAKTEAEHGRKIFNNIMPQKPRIVTMPRKLLRATAIAASILLLLSLGYLYFKPAPSNDQIIVQVPAIINKEIVPGSDKARLTLDDGTQIELDTAKNGLMARQGTASIMNDDGTLLYDGTQGDGHLRYNTLTTVRGEQYRLELSDGTKIILDASTTLRFPVAFVGNERVVEINGRAWFEVAKNSEKPFYVVKGDKKIRVLGTHFDVNAYDNEPDLKVTLVEGSVEVMNGSVLERLAPGQQAMLHKKSNEIVVDKAADIEQAIAWKNGVIALHSADVSAIMREIERWYDVDVEIQKDLPKRSFYFDVSRKASLSELLKVLEINKINFTIDKEKRKLMILP